MTDKHIDWVGNPFKVGDTVKFGVSDSDNVGVVSKITDPDGDVDDETMKAIMIPPKVYVKYADGEEDWATGSNMTPAPNYMDPDPEFIWQFDDIEVVKDEDTSPWHSAAGDRP